METVVVALSIAAFVLLLAPAVLLPFLGGEPAALAHVRTTADQGSTAERKRSAVRHARIDEDGKLAA